MVEVRIGKSLKVIGEFKLIREDGTEETISGKRSFCRCGLSSSMPFCDSTHKTMARGVKKIEDEEVD